MRDKKNWAFLTMRANGSENRLALRSNILTCLNQHSVAVAEWSKVILRLRIAETSSVRYWLVQE